MTKILTDRVFEASKNLVMDFNDVLNSSTSFEIKGILNSEMLLFISLCDVLKANHIIESGRARAQSTEIISRWLSQYAPETKFDSIEFDENSPDIEIAKARIKATGFKVNAIFGDAFVVLPELIAESNDKVIVLIDGPKGIEAAKLALDALENDNVVAVCIHDIHKDDRPLRAALESWPNFYSSDDDSFVNTFSYLDESCWNEHQKYEQFRNWGPFQRGDVKMTSYGPTLVCLVNESDSTVKRNSIRNIKHALGPLLRRQQLIQIASKLAPNVLKNNSVFKKLALSILRR